MKGGVQRNPLIYENGDPFFEYQYRTGPFLKIRNGGPIFENKKYPIWTPKL